MSVNERLARIVTRVERQGFVGVKELSGWLEVSEVTIRRDLQRLHDEQRLLRTYGGAVSLSRGAGAPCEEEMSPVDTTSVMDRVDVFITSSIGAYTDQLLLDQAAERAIPIVAESLSMGVEPVVCVDNRDAGRALGRWAGGYSLEHFDGDAHLLDLTYHLRNTQIRSRGFVEGLREANPEAEVVLSINGQSRYPTAYQMVRDALIVHPHINLIFAINDIMASAAYRACADLGIDPDELLILPFGLEGESCREALFENSYCKAGLAMFPEIVGPVCVEAAVRAFNALPLPRRLITPHAILTRETLPDFYERGERGWELRWDAVRGRLSIPLEIEGRAAGLRMPERIGFIIPFSQHEWYQNLLASMGAHAEALGVELEVVDSEQGFKDEMARRRQAIAQRAAALVGDGEVLLVDAGPISTYLAEALGTTKELTVITNSLSVADILRERPGVTLILTGGQVNRETETLVGPTAEAALRELRADKLFLEVTGVSLDFGLSHTSLDDIAVKQAMMRAAREVVLLADHVRFGQESTRQVAPADAVDRLVTDDALAASTRLELTKLGVEVLIA
jgi:DeoR/GlpR family transcriptional regulator of sugar metabolism